MSTRATHTGSYLAPTSNALGGDVVFQLTRDKRMWSLFDVAAPPSSRSFHRDLDEKTSSITWNVFTRLNTTGRLEGPVPRHTSISPSARFTPTETVVERQVAQLWL